MFTLIAENQQGEQIELTHNENYVISEIVGLDPPEATLNMTKNAGADGSVFNSAYSNDRQITITLVMNAPAETNRINLYRWFKPKYEVKLYYHNSTRNVYISGYVQNIDIGFFERKQTMQIVIDCPQPYFRGYYDDIQEFNSVVPLFEFPFSIAEEGIPFSELRLNVEKNIINQGDVNTGVIIKIRASGTIRTPKIYNVGTGEYYILDYSLQSGDEVTINTRSGEKAVKLLRNGVESVLIGYLRAGSTWFEMLPGDNVYTIAADSGLEYMFVTFNVIDQYEGV